MIYLILIMIFLHIVDDYYLQGVLATLKKKESWVNDNYSYIAALLAHAFSWTFMIMLPLISTSRYPIMFLINFIIHAFVDDLKANKKKINLCVDQSIHIIQIIITALVLS